MITKEQFITLIEVTKSSMEYDFLEKNQFVIIDIDMQLHIPEHTRSLSGSLLGYKTIP